MKRIYKNISLIFITISTLTILSCTNSDEMKQEFEGQVYTCMIKSAGEKSTDNSPVTGKQVTSDLLESYYFHFEKNKTFTIEYTQKWNGSYYKNIPYTMVPKQYTIGYNSDGTTPITEDKSVKDFTVTFSTLTLDKHDDQPFAIGSYVQKNDTTYTISYKETATANVVTDDIVITRGQMYFLNEYLADNTLKKEYHRNFKRLK